MALTEQDLDEARQKLATELQIVETELVDLGFPADGEVNAHFDEGFADAAQSTSERAKVLSLVEGLMHRREDLQAALTRVERGTYGICDSCGKPIAPERLEAIPAARSCMECKTKQR